MNEERQDIRPGWSARPEAPWALWAGIAGALAATALSVKAIMASGSSTAAIGFIFVPFVAIAAMALAGIWGFSVGCVWYAARGAQRYAPAVLAAAWVLAVAAPAALAWEVWRGLALERAVAQVRAMGADDLEQAFERSAWRRDRFFLGAMVQNPNAGAALLDRIARLEDPDLAEPMGSLWNVMGENTRGIAVLRLLAAHANADPATLARLADGPYADKLRHELARNPRTPIAVLRRWFESTDHLVEWGLALNPNTPPEVMERLARSANVYTRINLARNEAAPRVILERLAADADELVARTAKQALARRR
jgi:hypothetical protein